MNRTDRGSTADPGPPCTQPFVNSEVSWPPTRRWHNPKVPILRCRFIRGPAESTPQYPGLHVPTELSPELAPKRRFTAALRDARNGGQTGRSNDVARTGAFDP